MSNECLFAVDKCTVHEGAVITTQPDLSLTTPDTRWAYAVSFPALVDGEGGSWLITAIMEVERGTIGIGVLRADGSAYLEERLVSSTGSPSAITLQVPAGPEIGDLVIRNASETGPSSARVLELASHRSSSLARPYLVSLSSRDVTSEPRPPGGGTVVFDTREALTLNAARRQWLSTLRLSFSGKRVLDVGCGVGHFVGFYRDRGCTVVGLDGRAENIDVLRQRHPDVETYVGDIQRFDLSGLGQFDIVHCFGLLYHLEDPVTALRHLRAACREVLLLETMVCDSAIPLMLLEDETKAASQALDGLGCRPSPPFVALALSRVGFRHVYGTIAPPAHADFQFEWRNSLDVRRDGHSLRSMFVASDAQVPDPTLVSLLDG